MMRSMHTATGMVHSRDTDLGPLILLGPTLHSHIFVIDDHQGSHAAYPYQLLLYFFFNGASTSCSIHAWRLHEVVATDRVSEIESWNFSLTTGTYM